MALFCIPLQICVLTSVSAAKRLSNTSTTWPSTKGSIQARNLSSVQSAASVSPTRAHTANTSTTGSPTASPSGIKVQDTTPLHSRVQWEGLRLNWVRHADDGSGYQWSCAKASGYCFKDFVPLQSRYYLTKFIPTQECLALFLIVVSRVMAAQSDFKWPKEAPRLTHLREPLLSKEAFNWEASQIDVECCYVTQTRRGWSIDMLSYFLSASLFCIFELLCRHVALVEVVPIFFSDLAIRLSFARIT